MCVGGKGTTVCMRGIRKAYRPGDGISENWSLNYYNE